MNASYPWYLTAVALIALMLNTFQLWQSAASALGPASVAVPVAAALLALIGCAVAIVRRRDRPAVPFALLGCAAVVAAVGLAVTDPEFPAKRIHVAQYIAVAWLIYRGLGPRLGGPRRAMAAAVISCLLGVHDELVQGLHPLRTFGAVDILTNCLGAAAGVLAALAVTSPMTGSDAQGAWRHVVLVALVVVAAALIYPPTAAYFELSFQ
jgi:VanZ family protein